MVLHRRVRTSGAAAPLLVAWLSWLAPQTRPAEPFIPIGVWYDGTEDLLTIRSLGFNSITTSVAWPVAEPQRSTYQLDVLERTLSAADVHGVKVIVQVETESPPSWLIRRRGGYCFSTADDRTDLSGFVNAVTTVAARHKSFHAIDVGSGPPAYTKRCRAGPAGTGMREQLELLVEAATARGQHPVTSHSRLSRQGSAVASETDVWWRTALLDHAAAAIHPKLPEGDVMRPARLGAALDLIRSVSREKGWTLAELQAGPGGGRVTAQDVRVWSWMALSRGARAIGYYAWKPRDRREAMVGSDGAITTRARAAADVATVVTSNPALFQPLRPRRATVAILSASPASDSSYRQLFARNIQSDFIHPDDVISGQISRYAVVVAESTRGLQAPVADALRLYERSGGRVVRTAAALDDLPPDVRIDGGAGLVETRFLESADALLLIAINHAGTSQGVTMTFAPDVPEAIWQNMETGASVNFVAGASGPAYTYTFAPRDVVVLMIRKKYR
ncbi:MAG: beta-galactosidase [Acidobacteria bacterium]|nr:beta-galactosidase [Acidobacteriota bacterium]MCA1651001.1 beta-galactosidase [Acidobacteriota bacterium]